MLGLSSVRICSLHNSIHPPEMDKILWRWCVAAHVVWQQKTVTHAALSPHAVHLSMYNCIYWLTLRVFIRGDPQSIYTGWPSEYSAGECYNHPLFHQQPPLPPTTPSSINNPFFHHATQQCTLTDLCWICIEVLFESLHSLAPPTSLRWTVRPRSGSTCLLCGPEKTCADKNK